MIMFLKAEFINLSYTATFLVDAHRFGVPFPKLRVKNGYHQVCQYLMVSIHFFHKMATLM